jgi:hypothetical protein
MGGLFLRENRIGVYSTDKPRSVQKNARRDRSTNKISVE